MTCKDCIHEDLCGTFIRPCMPDEANASERLCKEFKNKADFVEVRCKDCKHRREIAHRSYCLPVFGLKQITDLDAFCSYGEKKPMKCKDCPIRKYYAKAFDIHFDEKDCICKCPYKKQ